VLPEIVGRAAVVASGRAHTLAASVQDLRPPEPGPIDLEAEILRPGRTATHVRVRMSQGGGVRVESLLVTGRLDELRTPPGRTAPDPPAPPAPPGATPSDPVSPPDGSPAPIMDEVAIDLDHETAGFSTGTPSGRGDIAGWLTLPGDEQFDDCALLYAVDALTAAAFDITTTGWCRRSP
jgi:hypothetical protein